MAYSNMTNDVSLQQFSELWESSRYSHRMPVDPDSLTHLLEKTEHELPDLSLSEMANRTATGEMDESPGLRIEQVPDSITVGNSRRSEELRGNDDDKSLLPKLGTPSWLSNALMRQQAHVSCPEGNEGVSTKWCSACGGTGSHCMCTNSQAPSPPLENHPYTDWFSTVPTAMHTTHPGESSGDLAGTSSHFMESAHQMSHSSGGRDPQRVILGLHMDEAGTSHDLRSGYASGEKTQDTDENTSHQDRVKAWQEARLKAKMLMHPLFSQMLAAHVGCLRIATPVDQLQKIDEQLSQSQFVIDKYSVFAPEEGEDMEDKEELDEFMRSYTLMLMDMQERLENHVRVHATEAMMGCWELEQQLYALTGVSPGQGTGATMSDEEEEQVAESEAAPVHETGVDVQDSTGGFGPLVPTETERSLMERVRQELKLELNEQGYRDKIVDVREEILRKRRAGKLPEGTTTVLKAWWNAHSKWPYPTEDEKERLIQETGLELKQVNNWFINQRKRNWHSNPLSTSNELKNKRKA